MLDYVVSSDGVSASLMVNTERSPRCPDLGYRSEVAVYRAVNCKGCPLRGMCYKGRSDRRTVEVNHTANGFKRQARQLLTSERGMMHRSRRPIEPEAVFGDIKFNHGFRRFRLKSNREVRVEFGLVALAHNLRKYSAILSERMMGGVLSMLQYRWPIQLHTDANNRDTSQKWFSVKGKTIIGCNLKKLQPIIVSIKANETDLKNPFWVGLFYNHRVPLY